MSNHEALRAAVARAAELSGAGAISGIPVNPMDLAELLAEFDALRAGGKQKRGKGEYPAEFLEAYDAVKAAGSKWREGSTLAAAFKQWQARMKAGADAEQVLEGTRRYGLYLKATCGEPKMAQTFFGPGEHYTAEWLVPRQEVRRALPDRRGAPTADDARRAASEEAKRRLRGIPADDGRTFENGTP